YAYWQDAQKPGERVAQQHSPHLNATTDAHDPYTTDPPTSGPHVPDAPPFGVLEQAVPKELQVHALEDAGVVINYQPTLDKDTVGKLRDLVYSLPQVAVNNVPGGYVLMTPYDKLSNPIVLTAWTRIQRFDKYDEAAIRLFINSYRGIDHHKDSGS